MSGATSHVAWMYGVMSPGSNAVARRWSMFTQSGVVVGELAPVERGVACVTTDHVCAWAAASPARYRASSSAKAASMSSRSNATRAAIRLLALISTMPSASVWNASGPLIPARGADTTESKTLPAGRNDGRRHDLGTDLGERPACSRFRHLDRFGSRCSRPDGDRRWKSRRPVSPPSRPSRGPRSKS